MAYVPKRLVQAAMAIAVVALVAAIGGCGNQSSGSSGGGKGGPEITYVGKTVLGTGNNVRVEAACPKGLSLIGGGVHTADPSHSQVEEGHPDSQNEFEAVVRAGHNEKIEAIAICTQASKVSTVGTPLPPMEKESP